MRTASACLRKSSVSYTHLNVRAEVYLNDQIQGPLVSGVLRPLIFLPASLDFRDPELLRNILLHECAHIRRRDNLMKLAALLALCIHWFNPLVWLMVNWISRDLEEACDETVLTILDVQQRQSYEMCIRDRDKAMSSELLLFPHDVYGMVLNLEEDHVGAVLLGDDTLIKEGDEVKRTGRRCL